MDEQLENEYKKASEPIKRLQSLSPEALVDHLATGPISSAPSPLRPHLTAIATRGLSALSNALPRTPTGLPGDHQPDVTAEAKKRFLEIHKIVDDPLSVLDHAHAGTLTPEHMSILKQVHPEQAAQIRAQAAEQLAAHKKPESLAPHAKRSLGLLMDQPIQLIDTQPGMAAIMAANTPSQSNQLMKQKPSKAPSAATQKTIEKTDRLYATPLERRQIDRKS
jgi:hypothetical protein